jgi:predicted nucleic acid-binding protein
MSAERVLIDTNVLVYATDSASPRCPAASANLVARVSSLGTMLGTRAQDVFDLAIAVTALESDVRTIYSYDSTVFSRVPGVTVREPVAVFR